MLRENLIKSADLAARLDETRREQPLDSAMSRQHLRPFGSIFLEESVLLEES
jgi:hypothetical protein